MVAKISNSHYNKVKIQIFPIPSFSLGCFNIYDRFQAKNRRK